MSEATTAVATAARTTMKTAMTAAAAGSPATVITALIAITATPIAAAPALTARVAVGFCGRRAWRWGCGWGWYWLWGWRWVGGQVGGERGQLGVGPRRQRLADPFVQFVRGQPTLHECGLEGADHLLAVGMGRAPAALA